MQLKCLASDSPMEPKVWDRVTWCIQHASEAERTSGTAQIRILEEVDATATQLDPHWLSSHFDSFLYLATECQLYSYLEHKLDGHFNWLIPILLDCAVFKYRVFSDLVDRPACRRRIPSVKVIELLLERGGDPNTIWEEILDFVPRQPTIENQAWLDIIKLFLDHGADPWVKASDFPVLRHEKTAKMIKEKRRWYQVLSIIHYVFKQPRGRIRLV